MKSKNIVAFGIGLLAFIVLNAAYDSGAKKQAKADCEKYNRWESEYRLFEKSADIKGACDIKEVLPEKETIKLAYEVVEILTAKVSAYNSTPGQTDESPFEMASGKTVFNGAIACPTRYKFGTKAMINGQIYICEDRMAARYRQGNYFDIWMLAPETAKAFGSQTLEITIIK